MTFDALAQVRLIWITVAFVLFGIGGGLVWWPSSQQIAQVRAHAKESYDEANDLAMKLRRASEIREASERVRNDLRALGGSGSDAATSANFLRLLNDESHATDVTVKEFVPEGVAKRSKDLLPGTGITLSVRGRFRNIIRFIADLPRHDVLIEIHDAGLQSAFSNDGVPVLTATVHATMYHLTSQVAQGMTNARALR